MHPSCAAAAAAGARPASAAAWAPATAATGAAPPARTLPVQFTTIPHFLGPWQAQFLQFHEGGVRAVPRRCKMMVLEWQLYGLLMACSKHRHPKQIITVCNSLARWQILKGG